MCDRGLRGGDDCHGNYFVPLAGGVGQTAQRQLNGLAPLGEALSEALGKPISVLANAQRLCPVQSGRARSDLGVSRDPAPRRVGCVAWWRPQRTRNASVKSSMTTLIATPEKQLREPRMAR